MNTSIAIGFRPCSCRKPYTATALSGATGDACSKLSSTCGNWAQLVSLACWEGWFLLVSIWFPSYFSFQMFKHGMMIMMIPLDLLWGGGKYTLLLRTPVLWDAVEMHIYMSCWSIESAPVLGESYLWPKQRPTVDCCLMLNDRFGKVRQMRTLFEASAARLLDTTLYSGKPMGSWFVAKGKFSYSWTHRRAFAWKLSGFLETVPVGMVFPTLLPKTRMAYSVYLAHRISLQDSKGRCIGTVLFQLHVSLLQVASPFWLLYDYSPFLFIIPHFCGSKSQVWTETL